MPRFNTTLTTTAALALSALALTACDNSAPSATNTNTGNTAAEPTADTGPSWLLTAAPENPTSIADAKASAKEGDTITLRGIIGGEMKPMTAESPVIRVVDADLYNRCTAEAGHCNTPWDYCCADPDDLRTASATVQIVNADGSAFTGSPIAAGLEPLDEIVITGTVAPRPTGEVLVIKATGIHRVNG
jgi:hypothetical protein